MSTDIARADSRADRRRGDLPSTGRGRPPVLALLARATRSAWLPVLVAIAPMLAGVAYLALYRGDFSPFGDGVYLEAHVREIGVHPVLLGPFSRYGWSHPGPAIYALLAPSYRLFGSSFRGVAIGALLVNAACVVAIAVGVRRRLGHAAMLATLLVITVYLLILDPAELRNSWNPYLPILPFALACLLCWSLVEGSRWALPAAVALASFAVQSHVGFVLPAAGITVATAGLLVLRRLRSRRLRSRQAGTPTPETPGWRAPLLVTAGAVVALWLPPVVEQLTTSPGNLQAIADYFRRSRPDGTWSGGLHALADDLGALPARVTGHATAASGLGVPPVPGWSVVVAVLLFGLAIGVARRRPEIRTLAVLAVTLAVVSVVAVRRVVGPPYDYLVAWTLLAGVLLWLTVGLAGAGAVRDWITARQPGPVRSALETAACGLAVVALGVIAVPGVRTQVRPDTAWVYTDGVTPALRTQVVAALGPDAGTVRVQPRPRSAAEFLDVTNRSASLLLALRKSGIDAQAPPESRAAFGARYVEHAGAARTSLSVLTRGGTPPAGSRLVAAAGSVVVYASP